MSEWISVYRQNPPAFTDILLALSTGKVVVGSRFASAGYDWAETDDEADLEANVTHWMPLPSPPTSVEPPCVKEK